MAEPVEGRSQSRSTGGGPSTWDYRVIEDADGFHVHEVYYDDAEMITAYSAVPAAPYGEEGPDELRSDLGLMLAALDRPTIHHRDLPTGDELSPMPDTSARTPPPNEEPLRWVCGHTEYEEDGPCDEPARVPPSCICSRFSDTGGFRIADLTCPVHGVGGSHPGDGYWIDDVEQQ